MSDYLTTLAARSLNLAPIVAPRVASLFEPAASSGSVGIPVPLEIGNEGATPSTRTAGLPRDEAPPALDTRTPVVQIAAPPLPVAVSRDAPPPEDPSTVAPVRLKTEAAVLLRPTPLIVRQPAPDDDAPAPNPRSGASSESLVNPDVRRESSTEIPAQPTPLRLDDVLRRLTDETLTALDRRTAQRDHVGEPPRPLETRVPAVRVLERGDPIVPRPTRSRAEARVTDPVPTVRVTIGRIEVRAITPPAVMAPQPAPSAPPSTTSLEEYLKQRSGGGR